MTFQAKTFLANAAGHIGDRATQYDAPQGERSMAKTVALFNTLTGHNLSEVDGWQMMELLKMVRSRQGNFKADNFEDGAAYAALAGEAAANQNSLHNVSEVKNVHDRTSSKNARNGAKTTVRATTPKRNHRAR